MAASEGIWLLRLASPWEMTTTCFPLTAGRGVGSTSRLVPFSAAAVEASIHVVDARKARLKAADAAKTDRLCGAIGSVTP